MCAVSVFFVSLKEHENIYLESVKDNLSTLSANVADELLMILSESVDDFQLKNQLLIFDKYKHIQYAFIYDQHWKKIEQYISLGSAQVPFIDIDKLTVGEHAPDESPKGISRHNGVLVSVVPIGDPVSPVGYLQVIHDFKTPIEHSRNALFFTGMPFVVSVLLVSLLLTWYLFRRVLTPLISLSEFTRVIERTRDYSLRFETKGSDEVANLSKDINSMLETINKENQLNKEQYEMLRQQQAQLYQLANYDQLTDLPNRRYVIEFLTKHLQLVKEQRREVVTLYFDVDSFKAVNDRMGHEKGDKLLIKITELVRACLRPNDMLARLAGDEFLVVLIDCDSIHCGILIAERIVRLFEHPVMIGKWEIHTGVSVGLSLASQSAYDVDALISNADIAMYVSKQRGRGSYTVFEPDMLSDKRRKLQIVNAIPLALEHEEFSLVYQPKISRDGDVNGLEALIRWHSPELGFVSPGEFVPIAESGGRIGDITKWVVKRVVGDLKQILEICGPETVVSLNISSKDLLASFLEEHIVSCLEGTDQNIRSLQFEITESSYLEEFDIANDFFARIRELGGSIALDDFGTGYSSLSYLTRIEIDTLKIDRQFIFNALNSERDATILNSIIEMSNRVELFSCCEGIETPEHARYLIEHGCDSLQGFYFSYPVPLNKLAAAVDSAKRKFSSLYEVPVLIDRKIKTGLPNSVGPASI